MDGHVIVDIRGVTGSVQSKVLATARGRACVRVCVRVVWKCRIVCVCVRARVLC